MTQLLGRILAASALAFALLGIAAAEGVNPAGYTGKIADRKQICMLQDTVQARDGLEADYHGKKYYLCCAGCLAGFKGNPVQYSQATDPVDGKLVDKADAAFYAYRGRAYFFSSQENLSAFERSPEAYLRSAASTSKK